MPHILPFRLLSALTALCLRHPSYPLLCHCRMKTTKYSVFVFIISSYKSPVNYLNSYKCVIFLKKTKEIFPVIKEAHPLSFFHIVCWLQRLVSTEVIWLGYTYGLDLFGSTYEGQNPRTTGILQFKIETKWIWSWSMHDLDVWLTGDIIHWFLDFVTSTESVLTTNHSLIRGLKCQLIRSLDVNGISFACFVRFRHEQGGIVNTPY